MSPSIEETLEWVEQYHWQASEDGAADFCSNCGARWPCVPARLAAEVKRLTGLMSAQHIGPREIGL
jgi:hypothetical protein